MGPVGEIFGGQQLPLQPLSSPAAISNTSTPMGLQVFGFGLTDKTKTPVDKENYELVFGAGNIITTSST